MVNELFDAMKAGHGNELIAKTLDGLIDYTVSHLDYEEQLLAKTSYPAAEAHKREHEALKRQVLAIREKMRVGVSTMEVMMLLKAWLVNHIQGSDMKYAPHLAAKGVI